MRRRGPVTIRHMVVAALVVVVVNAQLTWWIIYSLRENRNRLRLEREHLVAACAEEVQRVETAMTCARGAVVTALANRLDPSADPPPPAFASWTTAPDGEACTDGWTLVEDRLQLAVATPDGCVVAQAAEGWIGALLTVEGDLEVTAEPAEAAAHGRRAAPGAQLPPPLEERIVRPRPAVWSAVLEGYRGRIVMMVSEGTFFAALLLVMVALLWRTLRREVELEHQHRNFLSAITHELKSPLASMRLALETVLRGRADGTASLRFLENALQDTERLQSLVQKVLEVTRYGRGDGTLKPRKTNLSEVVEDTVHAFARRATSVGVNISIKIQPEVWIEIDEEAFGIVLSNLLENAIKYGGTPPEVGVTLTADGSHAVLEVRDNGRGIPSGETSQIFDRFYRCGDEMTRTTQGTGLGLFLVQQIVTAHRGTVAVAHTGPKGSTFRVTLPNAEVWGDGE